MDSASSQNCFMRHISRPNSVAVDAQPRLRRRSSYQESLHSEQRRRHSLETVTQPRHLRRSSFQEPFNSEQQRRHKLETGTQPKHQRRRSFQGSFDSDTQRKDSLEFISEERKKAAAWAWYQHEGGLVASTKRVIHRQVSGTEAVGNRPRSRFKTEAMNSSNSATDTPNNSLWDCESALYDSFELQSFSEQLHRVLLGEPISADRSSIRFQGPSLHQLSSCGTQSMTHHISSFTVPVGVQNAAVNVTVDRQECNENAQITVAELEEKTKKSTVVGRPFEIISKAIRKITKSRHTTDEACPESEDSRNQHHVHHHHHHFFYHHYRDKEAAHDKEVPVPTAPSRKSLKTLFAIL